MMRIRMLEGAMGAPLTSAAFAHVIRSSVVTTSDERVSTYDGAPESSGAPSGNNTSEESSGDNYSEEESACEDEEDEDGEEDEVEDDGSSSLLRSINTLRIGIYSTCQRLKTGDAHAPIDLA